MANQLQSLIPQLTGLPTVSEQNNLISATNLNNANTDATRQAIDQNSTAFAQQQEAIKAEEDRVKDIAQAQRASHLLSLGNIEAAAAEVEADGDILGVSLGQAIRSGETDTAIDVLAQISGALQNNNTENLPASVQEFMFRTQLGIGSEADKAFMSGKRGVQFVEVGGVPHVLDQTSGKAFPVQTPEGQATLQGEIEALKSQESAKVQGQAQATIETAAPIAQAEAEAERIAVAPETIASAEAQITAIDQTMDTVNAAIGNSDSAGFNALFNRIPGTDANLLRTQINTIKANLAFDKLQSMRNLSKTGGALGQVSERELNLLESAVAALDQTLGDEQLKSNLQTIMQHYQNARFVLRRIIDVNQGRISERQAQDDVDTLTLNRVGGPADPELPQEPQVISFGDLPDG